MGLTRHDEQSPERPPDFGRQVRYPSPNIEDLVVIEDLPIKPSKYKPLKYGTHHPDYDNNGLILVWQGPVKAANNQVKVRRVYATDQSTPDDWYNYAIKFSGDAVANPIFIRTTIVLRKDYTPTARGTTIATPNAGAPSGQVPTFNQPIGATLVKEETSPLGSDDQMLNSLFIRVHRVYEVLPGPWLTANRKDPVLGAITGRRRAVANTGQVGDLTNAHSLRYEARDGSSVVSWEIEEAWNNAAFPEVTENAYDLAIGPIAIKTKATTDTSTGANIDLAGPLVTRTSFKPYPENQALRIRTQETFVVPGIIQTSTEFEKDGVKKVVTRQLKKTADIVTQETLVEGTSLTRKYSERYSEYLSWEIVEVITVTDSSLLALPGYTTRIPNVIPEVFMAQLGLQTDTYIIEGTAQYQDLGAWEFEHSEKQLTPLYKEVRSTYLPSLPLPITLSGGKETNERKQEVSVVMTLGSGSSATPPTALTDVDFRNLGNGLSFEITKTIASVFNKDTRSIEIPDVAPAWAKALLPTTRTSIEAAATSVADPTLATGQLRKEVRRTTEMTVQTDITSHNVASLPKTRTNKRLTREFGGGAVDEVQTQATGAQAISSGGLLVLDSEMEVLGDGTSVLKTTTQTDGSWPILSDYDIDPETGQTILTTYQVVAAGSAATATSASGVVTTYKHIDKWRSLKIITTYSTPAGYDEQRFGAHNFPTLWDGDYSWTTACGAFAPGMRGAFSAMVEMRTAISYSTSKETISGLTLIPKSLLVGRGWQMPQDLIMDAGTLFYTGECTGSISFGGSDPTYSTYVGGIQGTEQLITGESVRTKSGLYRNTRVYVTML